MHMSSKNLKKIFISIALIYTALVVSFYFLGGDQIRYRASAGNIEMPDANAVTDEIIAGKIISQDFVNKIEHIEKMEIVFTKFYRDSSGIISVSLYDGNTALVRNTMKLSEVPEQSRVYLIPEEPLTGLKGKTLTIKIYTTAKVNHGVAAMMRKDNTGHVNMNGTDVAGTLCFSLTGYDDNPFGEYYWQIVGTIGVILGIMLIASYRLYLKGRYTYIVSAIAAVYRYEFLISQLVIRDFKSKYKRSILGVFWSFLNPLLTMTVQFLVFSTFFKANTQNYPVYLLSGVVCFSFFNECTTMCLTSISGNSRLITKVYIPKYIFPLARTISSSVNLAISLVPLFLACLVLGVAIRPQALLFFYFLVCLIVFSLGIGLFLSALMVFFRDIQFLWTVLIQIWQYATPIFYPAEIVPEKYRFILRFNPLYHFIGNARTCLIDGISPEPRAYIFCFIFALVSILIGSFTFKKTQDKFALYL